MNTKKYFAGYAFLLVLFIVVISLTGCGSGATDPVDKSSEKKPDVTPGVITGKAIKGPISGGTVTAYAVNSGAKADGLGNDVTDTDGNYSIPTGNYSGPIFLEITGGSYIDEATGDPINLPTTAGSGLQVVVDNVLPGSTMQCQITPLTTMAAARAQNMPGGLTASNISAANQEIGALYGGIDIINTQPINPLVSGSASGASDSAINYGLILAGLSQEAMTKGLSHPFDLFTPLAQDISDGTFDGKSGSSNVNLDGSPMDPATGTSLLMTAINTFSQDKTHNVSGGTVTGTLLTVINQQTWAKTYGGENAEWPSNIQQTSDGGYILAGSTESFGSNGEIWVIKLDESGDVSWQKSYGGEGWEWISSIQKTSDGGYILAGSTYAPDSNGAIWVIKLDGSGVVSWQKSYGVEGLQWVSPIRQTLDGGYAVASSTADPVDGNDYTWLIIKLDENGSVQWEKSYVGEVSEWPSDIQPTLDGGYVVAGFTSDSVNGSSDIWVTKLDEKGEVKWQRSYIGEGSEWPSDILPTSDGGYILAGSTNDPNGGNGDAWVIRLDESGEVNWQKAYSGEGWDGASSIQQVSDGGYILAGSTYDASDGNSDALVMKLDESGNMQWQKAYGGEGLEGASSIQQTSDGSYIVAAYTDSFGAGNEDIWVLKLDSDGNVNGCMNEMNISSTSPVGYIDTSVSSNVTSVVSEPISSSILETSVIGADSSATPVTWCTGVSGEDKTVYTLTVTREVNGVVTSDPAGINCGYEDDGYGGLIWREDCTHVYPDGAIITLTAAPSTRSAFAASDWSGDDDCADGQVTMDADKTCTATFSSRYRLDYVSGDNQTWAGGDMPLPMIFKIFDKATETYVENGFDGLNMSTDGDTGFYDYEWCWGCYRPDIETDIDLTNVTRETRNFWYVDPCEPQTPYDLYLYVNAIDSYTGEDIENSPYLMHYTISRDDTYCAQVNSATTMPQLISPINNEVIIQNDSSIAIECPADSASGYGYEIFFDWDDSVSSNGIAGYYLYVQHKDSQYPIVDTFVTSSDYTYTSCNSFIIDANLSDWEWRVRAEDNQGNLSRWSSIGVFQFGQCRLDDGNACYASP